MAEGGSADSEIPRGAGAVPAVALESIDDAPPLHLVQLGP
jgi:hypothetical protein